MGVHSMINYRNIIDNIGFMVRMKKPHIPDKSLMIGSVESHESIPLLIYENYQRDIPKPLQKPINQMKLEEVTDKLDGVHYTVNDFINNDFYLGNSTGGY